MNARQRRGPETRPRVGCAGWSIAPAYRDRFGPGDSALARYATRFDVVEINSSFHRPHRPDTWRRWGDSVPDAFRFSAKLPRTITHELRLRGVGPALDVFLDAATCMGPRLGCLLVQLPPSLRFEARVAATFFAMLRRRWTGPVACEPRHPSWFGAAAGALLRRHGIARVAADPALLPAAACPGGDDATAYWRWHGSPETYASAYDGTALRALAASATASATFATACWVIFDNTARGHATPNALDLQALLAGR